jgi:TrmH family RNA methyltransferase
MKYTRYKSIDNYSYTLGVYPTLELLKYKPEKCVQIIFSSKSGENKGCELIRSLCEKRTIPFEINDKQLQVFSSAENVYCAGVFEKYETKVGVNGNHLVLVNPEDMGNVGTIIRSCLAFNMKNLVVIKPAVDIFDPKVVRSSMGSIFDINIQYFDRLDSYLKEFDKDRQFYAFDKEGLIDLKILNTQSPYSLIFGAESSGLQNFDTGIVTTVKINQSEAVDSINLANAVSIALYMTQ